MRRQIEFIDYLRVINSNNMKTLLLVLVFGLCIAGSYAQTLTLSEMIEQTKCNSFSCFNSYILGKGFSFKSNDTGQFGNLYSFNSNEFVDSLPDFIYKTQCQFFMGRDVLENESHVIFYTYDRLKFLLLSKQLDGLNFKVIKENSSPEEGVETYYASPKYEDIEIRVLTHPSKNKLGKDYAHYMVKVVRKNR